MTAAATMPIHEMLREFHEAFKLDNKRQQPLRDKLICQEIADAVHAIEDGSDLELIACELADVVYVCYGTALVYGIDLDRCLDLCAAPVLPLRDSYRERQAAHYPDVCGKLGTRLASVMTACRTHAAKLGIDLDSAVAEVHRANMSKLDINGNPVLRGDGNILRSPLYIAPDFRGAIIH